MKKARVALRSIVKCKRVKRNEEQDEDKDEEKQNGVKAPSYSSKLLNCTRCEEVIETK